MNAEEAELAARLLGGAALEIVPTRHLLRPTVELSIGIDHPACDCLYLALALERDLAFVTADERLVRKLGQLPTTEFAGTALTLSEALQASDGPK